MDCKVFPFILECDIYADYKVFMCSVDIYLRACVFSI